MTTVTSQNLLDVIKAYFASLGLEAEAGSYLTARNFVEGLVLKLPAVCLVPGNKPDHSRSKQTHIHVTGNNRYFFFPAAEVNRAAASSADQPQDLLVSEQNIAALRGRAVTGPGLSLRPSHTMKKIACRAAQETQVQISKLRADGRTFIDLRNSLYENDLLVFLKQRTGSAMFAVGIPRSFYEDRYVFQSDVYTGLESRGAVTVRNALAAVMEEYGGAAVVDSDDAISDAVYQELVAAAPRPGEIADLPVPYLPAHPEGRNTRTTRPPTNPVLGRAALIQCGYRCAVDGGHATFLRKSGERYLEVHHLVPLEWQEAFLYQLDVPANLVPLCPLCHRLLHYGRMEEKIPILTRLYEARRERLLASGISITLEELLRFYE